jgi:clan AA aspartic protease
MGLTFIDAVVTGPQGRSRPVKFLIDTGASYSLLPYDVWQEQLKPLDKLDFTLADGAVIERDVSECQIRINGDQRHWPVIFGIPGDEPLLGVVTLEILGLVLDPFQRTLRRMKLRLG